MPIQPPQAIARLMRFLAVPGITGEEKLIAEAVRAELIAVGVPKNRIRFDMANEKIPLPTQTGNLIVDLPGTRPGPRLLFSTHLDTVPLCAGAVPLRKGDRIVPKGKTALGGDNRTGVACLVNLVETLLNDNLPHGPTTILFTVREESGLWGARFVDAADLHRPTMGFNVDGRSARDVTIGAVGADRWEVEIFGKASHAGVHPQKGISACMVVALALAKVYESGWFGKIRKEDREGTSNVGPIGDAQGRAAGQATNVVTDYVKLLGESRSHDAKFVGEITKAYREAFEAAAKQVKNEEGKSAKVKFAARRDYFPFRLKETSPAVKLARAAAEVAGWSANLRTTNGGLDANWLSRNGIPTITFGAGQNNPHTVDEFVELSDYLEGCRYAVALAAIDA
ncbi:MAG: M20/M25/M40 family metallo-hydrolase [Gemmataceae bacterium]|nr:M20/M25/M40 family metallo-hydrolase [Gemmataceae bacterium]